MLIMWYREDVRSPIYSIDTRSGLHIPSPPAGSSMQSHWVDTDHFGHNRVMFDTSPGAVKARLKIFNVTEADDGLYRCRVDFKEAQTRTSRVNLTVIVRPSKPTIRLYDVQDTVEGYLGPYQIGTKLSLICQVRGGKPLPRVVWFRNGLLVQQGSTTWTSRDHMSGETLSSSNLTVESLQREDVHTKLTCQTSNYEATILTTSVELDLIYQAHNVSILNKGQILRAGTSHSFVCMAVGSRPPATLTWWFDDEQVKEPLDGVQVTENVSGETSTSTLMYVPRAKDTNRTLHCRATNPEIHRGVLEDKWTLNVQYPPQVSIQLGRSLVANDIRQGVDVYFDCIIHANPPPATKIVTWLHNGDPLYQNFNDDIRAKKVLPSVNDPNVLVLQGVKKAARGNYSCRVGNGIPTHDYEVESEPVFLDVKFPPVCTPKGVKVYGVAKMETAHIACNVEANPQSVAFRWTFNNSAEAKQVEERFIHTNGTRSILTFTPTRTLEYGTLMCWSKNVVGEQHAPCVFHIIAAGKPEAVQNCSVVNESTDTFQVHCSPGFNGGLPQQFLLSVYVITDNGNERNLVANLTANVPRFSVPNLQPGSHYIGEIVGFNVKGTGVPTLIKVYTLKLPEKLIPPIVSTPAKDESRDLELNPWMLTLLGIGAGVLVVIVLVTITIRIHSARTRRRAQRSHSSESGNNKVVVTTIEELDQFEELGAKPDVIAAGYSRNQEDRRFQEFGSVEIHSGRTNGGLSSSRGSLERVPRSSEFGFRPSGSIDYCTMRRPQGMASRRAVQFADQMENNDSFEVCRAPAHFPPPPPGVPPCPGAAGFTYATLRPSNRGRHDFHDFVPPPPPPMFETAGTPSMATPPNGTEEQQALIERGERKSNKESTV